MSVAKLEINETDTLFRILTDPYELPRNLTETYVEIDYACTGNYFVALRSNDNNGIPYQELPLLEIRSTGGAWNKIYVDLTEIVTREVEATTHEVVITGVLADGETRDEFYFDNLKLIHW